jgi:hypothetical protein
MTREIPTFITPSFAEREVHRNLEESGMRSPAAVLQWRNDRFVEFLMCEVFIFIIFYLYLRKILSGVANVIPISGKESSEGLCALPLRSGKVAAAVIQEHADLKRILVRDCEVESIILVELPDSDPNGG